MQPISFTVLNNLSDNLLRAVQHELIVKVEALRADDIRPARGVVAAIKQINDLLNSREVRAAEAAASARKN